MCRPASLISIQMSNYHIGVHLPAAVEGGHELSHVPAFQGRNWLDPT